MSVDFLKFPEEIQFAPRPVDEEDFRGGGSGFMRMSSARLTSAPAQLAEIVSDGPHAISHDGGSTWELDSTSITLGNGTHVEAPEDLIAVPVATRPRPRGPRERAGAHVWRAARA